MSYSISKYNGTLITTVQDGTIDTSLDIKLIGKSYAGYGQAQNENFVYLLENFSNNTPPPNPMSGQVWYDSGTKKLKFYDGSKFRTTGGAEIGSTAPTGLTVGDLWFDTVNKQLSAWDGSGFTLVGPQGVVGAGTTQMQSVSVRDSIGGNHAIVKAIVNGSVMYVVSSSEFILDSNANSIQGFETIRQGITLRNTTSDNQPGITTTDDRFWGTASNADQLGGYTADQYVKAGDASFGAVVNFSDYGYTVGSQNIAKLKVYIDTSNPTFESAQTSGSIIFKTTDNIGATVNTLTMTSSAVVPGVNGVLNLGAESTNVWNTVYAARFAGTADKSDALNVAGISSVASIANVTGGPHPTIVARDTTGTINVTYMNGTASQADTLKYGSLYVGGSASSSASTVVIRDASANISANMATIAGVTKSNSSSSGVGDIGQSNNRFGTVYATTFNGAVSGNLTGNTNGSHTGNVLASDSTVLIDATTKTFNGTINTSTGSILAGNGTASSPSIGFNSDGLKDTGFYWISDGIIGITNNGAYSGRIDASHNLTMVGDVYATVFHGVATSANYADLAEMYLADAEYDVGTVLMVGGDKEVTACQVGSRAVGPVSEHPAHLMNSGLEEGTAIALKGRVPVKVIGSILKGQRLVAGPNGTAQSATGNTADVFAIALESNEDINVKLVECIIL